MAETAGPSEPRLSSGGPIQSDDDPTSSTYAADEIQCSSCGQWAGSHHFQSKAKGHRSYTKTCLGFRNKKVRISRS